MQPGTGLFFFFLIFEHTAQSGTSRCNTQLKTGLALDTPSRHTSGTTRCNTQPETGWLSIHSHGTRLELPDAAHTQKQGWLSIHNHTTLKNCQMPLRLTKEVAVVQWAVEEVAKVERRVILATCQVDGGRDGLVTNFSFCSFVLFVWFVNVLSWANTSMRCGGSLPRAVGAHKLLPWVVSDRYSLFPPVLMPTDQRRFDEAHG